MGPSLVIFDDDQWEALLFPSAASVVDEIDGAGEPATTSTTGVAYDLSAAPPPITDAVPLLAPDGIDWSVTAFSPGLPTKVQTTDAGIESWAYPATYRIEFADGGVPATHPRTWAPRTR